MASLSLMVAVAAYILPVLVAAISDTRTLRIPNAVVAFLAATYPLAALLLGHGGDIPMHALAGLAVFAAAACLFAVNAMGGGDVKLLAAVALWAGPAGVEPLVLATALLGGVFALAVLVLRWVRGLETAPIPYGVPIALAAFLLAPSIFAA
jgi:prepilin peptidase CpaA